MADIQRVEHSTCMVLSIVGEFGREASPATRLRDEMALIPAPPRVVLDLGDMTSWDEATIGALIASLKRAMSVGGRLVIAAASPDLSERFRAQALPFERYSTVADAVAACGVQE
jgi:anti-anti-sigma factor